MNDLIRDLKDRLDIAEVIGTEYELVRAGRAWHAKDHPSLTVWPETGCWKWFSQGGGEDAKGDVLSWLAFKRFGKCRVSGEQFVELLREACKLAGLDFDKYAKGDGEKQVKRARRQRFRQDVLEAYVELAARSWTPDARKRIRAVKPYLTDEIIERWRLGYAPEIQHCRTAGIPDKALLFTGLARASAGDATHLRPYFWDELVIPFQEWGRFVYAASRVLPGPAAEGRKKTRCLPAPGEEDGAGGQVRYGVPMPAGFNLDVLADSMIREAGLFCVEAPLDALACTERGHPAVGMITNTPREKLCEILRGLRGVRIYMALDGDQTALQRCRAASKIGYYCRVCCLPEGKDPDDLTTEELAALKSEAIPVATAWLECLEALEQDPEARKLALEKFAEDVRRWREQEPAAAGELRAAICAGLKLTEAEFNTWLQSAVATRKRRGEARAFSARAPVPSERVKKLPKLPDPKSEAAEFLNGGLTKALEKATDKAGVERDQDVMTIFQRLSATMPGVPVVTWERVKSQVCKRLDLTRRGFDQAIREAVLSQEDSAAVDLDFAMQARKYLGELLPDRWIRRWREEWFEWTRESGGYQKLSREFMRAKAALWWESQGLHVTKDNISNFLEALMSFTILPDEVEPPCWLGELDGHVRREKGVYVAFENGILDLEHPERGLLEHSPDFFTLTALPYAYDSSASCPLFSEALSLWQPRAEARRLLQDFAGYCFERGNPRQVFLVCIGEGDNGKGQFAKLIAGLIGRRNVAGLGLEAFDGKKAFGLSPLLGKTLNIVGDANEVEKAGEGNIKAITGEDLITVDRKHKEALSVELSTKFLLLCNTMPPWRDRTEGLWRRMLISTWAVQVPKEKRVDRFAQRVIDSELAGIFNWALEGFTRVRAEGFKRDEEAVDEAKTAAHPEMQFFNECLESIDDGGVSRLMLSDVIARYNEWAKARNFQGRIKAPTMGSMLQKWIRKQWAGTWTEDQLARIKRRYTTNKGQPDLKRPEYYIGARLIPVEGEKESAPEKETEVVS